LPTLGIGASIWGTRLDVIVVGLVLEFS
jgi:hypothetical protein